jgi:uncharacterized small protein (DUF1192 family)
MDRTVESILGEWRQLERELDAASDAESQEDLQARIARLRDEHARAVADRLDDKDDGSTGISVLDATA